MPCRVWKTRKRGTLRQIGKKFPVRGKSKGSLPTDMKTMFFPTKGKYAEIVSLENPLEAQKSANVLYSEFQRAKTRAKKRRIIRVTALAMNRARASAKRKDLSPKERKELRRIGDIYEDALKRMELD